MVSKMIIHSKYQYIAKAIYSTSWDFTEHALTVASVALRVCS